MGPLKTCIEDAGLRCPSLSQSTTQFSLAIIPCSGGYHNWNCWMMQGTDRGTLYVGTEDATQGTFNNTGPPLASFIKLSSTITFRLEDH